MTELREALSELEAAIPPAPEDFESIRRVGAQRLMRRRLLGGSSLALVAVGLFFLATSISMPKAEQKSLEAAGSRTSWGSWTETASAPVGARLAPIGVWTGEDVLLFGGSNDGAAVNDGAAFSLEEDEWRLLSDAPLKRAFGRSALWTGEEMIVWGGETGTGSADRPDEGASYDPEADRWKELPASPVWSLAGHSAVWSGAQMLVWGGVENFEAGAAFDPAANDWQTLPEAPIDGRRSHAAVWTGTEMIVWGGAGEFAEPLNDGAAYNPDTGTWRVLKEGPLSPRSFAGAAWTGDEMVVWGGSSGGTGEDRVGLSDGAAYDPETDTWRKIAETPTASDYLGSPVLPGLGTVIVFGVDGRPYEYDPEANKWYELPEHESLPRRGMLALSAGSKVFVWGGTAIDGTPVDDNAIVTEGSRR